MAIESTYRTILLNDWLKEQLTGGVSVSALDIEEEVERLLEEMDLSVPQFVAEDYHVVDSEVSSATKYTETFSLVRQDLRALYKEMIRLTKVSTQSIERWRLEASAVEKKLIDLEDRIENLLLLTQDTEGYHSIVVDNFTDTAFTDLELSTAQLDLQGSVVQMAPSDAGSVRVFLNELEPTKDVTFKVRTTTDYVSRTDAENSSLVDPFAQESKSWWTSIGMRKATPVTCELTVKLGSEPVGISKIIVDLHDSSESGPVTITPLYSTDNQNFNQLPTNTFTQEVRTSTVFSFSSVDAKWVKFILTKQGPDPSAGTDLFFYEFGFKEISFYNEGFDADTVQKFISGPLYVVGEDGEPLEFEKLTLEACERVETNTSINYYITTALAEDDIDANFDPDTALWIPISPTNRSNPMYLQIIDVGDVAETVIGDTETVKVSYDPAAADTKLRNPASPFRLLSRDSTSGSVRDDSVSSITSPSTKVRYSFKNTNDRILNYQIKDTSYTGSGDSEDALLINEAGLVVFRNMGEQGLVATDTTSKVRDVQRGWRFEDPYYTCIIEVQNPYGMAMDVGDQAIIVDDISYTNRVDETVLTGKTATNDGIHRIKVHKSNWKEVPLVLPTTSLPPTTEAELKTIDPLYPHNHKLLVEGYAYDSTYSDIEPKVYTGADLFAEVVMRQVSIFDLMDNIAPDNYDMYALDRDTPNSHEGGSNPDLNNPTRVFVVKVDENNPDFQNERFMIRFTLINQLQKYFRLRADLATSDETITPALHSYKVKLG